MSIDFLQPRVFELRLGMPDLSGPQRSEDSRAEKNNPWVLSDGSLAPAGTGTAETDLTECSEDTFNAAEGVQSEAFGHPSA